LFWSRRRLLKAMGFGGLWSLLGNTGCERALPVTPEEVAAHYNNFYEFSEDKLEVHRLAENFRMKPWQVEVGGLVEKPRTFDLDDLAKLGSEERVYRFRCVEAWSMVVPWSGVPLARLLDQCRPLATAKFVRFVSFLRPEEAPNQKNTKYEWPYYEGLRMDEARHDLTLLVTGVYGHALPAQHGGPVRIIVPWKYGYKSPKSIVKIELVDHQPHTFWEDQQFNEYPFLSNVDPTVPHPRWSQATERVIGTGERRATEPFNGYAQQVAALYRR
jgi:sulfoxide reductase catalytic subunit YedY